MSTAPISAGHLPYNYYSDGYIMTNEPWLDGLSTDVHAALPVEGDRTSKTATNSILSASSTQR